jgi:hypothetical protein
MTQEEYDRSIIKHTKNIKDGQTLIQQQHIAAARIQAFMRMRQNSRRWVNITYPYLIRFRHVTTLVNEQLIDELLEDEIVPDVLIEIFSHAGDDEVRDPFLFFRLLCVYLCARVCVCVSTHPSPSPRVSPLLLSLFKSFPTPHTQGNDPFRPNPEQDRHVWTIWTEVMDETVTELADDVSRMVIRGYVNSYLQTRREKQQTALDPLSIVLQDYINEVTDLQIKQIVGASVQEMVQSYLRQQTADDFLNYTLQPLIEEVAMLAVDDIEVENVVNSMLSDYLRETCEEVAQESFVEMRDIIFSERQSRQYADVASAATRIFDNTSLRMLVRTMATNAESILMREYMNRLASGIMREFLGPSHTHARAHTHTLSFPLHSTHHVFIS